MSGFSARRSGSGGCPSFLILPALRVSGAVVGHPRRPSPTTSALFLFRRLQDRVPHLQCRDDPGHLGPGRVGQRDVGRDPRSPSAPRATGGSGPARIPCVPVDQFADEPYRVDLLPGFRPRRRPRGRPARFLALRPVEQADGHGEDLTRLGQPARRRWSAPVRRADRGVQDYSSPAAQEGHVGLGGRVLPHLGVAWAGRVQHRAPGGQQAWRSAARRPSRPRPGPAGRRWAGAIRTRSADWPSRTCGTSDTPVQDVGRDRFAGQSGPRGLADESEGPSAVGHDPGRGARIRSAA